MEPRTLVCYACRIVPELVERAGVEVRCGVCGAKGPLEAVLISARGLGTVSGGWEPQHPATLRSVVTTTEPMEPPFVFVPGDGVLNRLNLQ